MLADERVERITLLVVQFALDVHLSTLFASQGGRLTVIPGTVKYPTYTLKQNFIKKKVGANDEIVKLK